eukprot:gene33384-40388_t
MSSFSCYLLRSLATPKSTASYIGFSIDPHHRLRQHNGEVAAGAYHTSKYRPWIHVVIVTGFPNKVLALQFEWIWQHPDKSRFLKTVTKTKDGQPTEVTKRVNGYKPKLKILKAMLSLPIWKQLNLTVFVPDKSLQSFVFDLFRDNTSVTVICDNFVCEAQRDNLTRSRKRKVDANNIVLPTVISCSFCAQQLVARDKYFVCNHCDRSMHVHCLGRKSLELFSIGEEVGSMVPRLAECGNCHALCQWKHVIQKISEVSTTDSGATSTQYEQLVDNPCEEEDDNGSVCSETSQSFATQEGEAGGEDEEDFDVIIIDS